jgi:Ca-activated chloride channel family protein
MKSPLTFSSLTLLLLVSVGDLDAQRPSMPATFHSNSQMVLIPVTVTDRNGKTIEGLRGENFKILDNQTSQPIVSFASEDAPCSVTLVLDISGSMRSTLSIAKGAAKSFFSTANPDDEFLLLTVSTLPAAFPGFTIDIAALEKAIEFTRAGGRTALIDAVYLGLRRMRKAGRPRRALLILSDGMDNHSRYSNEELRRLALEADVQIYAIIIGNASAGASTGGVPFRPGLIKKPGDQAQDRQGLELLEKLSDYTGGLHFRVSDETKAEEAVIKVGRALRDEYLIGYRAPDFEASGKWHQVRVKLNVPKLNVHARNGYYSP